MRGVCRYLPTASQPQAPRSALRGLLQTFFGGSLSGAVKTFLSDEDADLTEAELSELAALIDQARADGASAPAGPTADGGCLGRVYRFCHGVHGAEPPFFGSGS